MENSLKLRLTKSLKRKSPSNQNPLKFIKPLRFKKPLQFKAWVRDKAWFRAKAWFTPLRRLRRGGG